MLYDMAGVPCFVCLKLRYASLSTSLDEFQRYSLQQIRRSQRTAGVRQEGAVSDQQYRWFGSYALSRKCHGSRGKFVRTCEQKVNKEEKLTLAFHRNLVILLGKLPLR